VFLKNYKLKEKILRFSDSNSAITSLIIFSTGIITFIIAETCPISNSPSSKSPSNIPFFALPFPSNQIGSKFVATPESSAHLNFKNAVIEAQEGATELTLKELTPVRMMKNKFYQDIQAAYSENASPEDLKDLLGRGRAKKGMFEGDMTEGELEIGQIASAITEIKPAAVIVEEIIAEFNKTVNRLSSLNTF
jgi:hypothetical protein